MQHPDFGIVPLESGEPDGRPVRAAVINEDELEREAASQARQHLGRDRIDVFGLVMDRDNDGSVDWIATPRRRTRAPRGRERHT